MEMQDLAQKIDVMPSSFAWIFFSLGEIDKGFDWLERAFEEREIWIFPLNVDPSMIPCAPTRDSKPCCAK